jgi:hypothetical protein
MFKKLAETIKKLTGQIPAPAFDPAAFADPVATKTQWTPLVSGGASFRTHKLHRASETRWEFRAGAGTLLFCGVFAVVGFAVLSYGTSVVDEGKWFLIPFGAVFATGGILMWHFMAAPVVFDKDRGYFCKGRKKPERQIDPSVLKHHVPLKEIHALQILSEYVRSDKSSYYSYELNLILKDGTRKNVIDHGNLKAIREDAMMLADFLGLPLWDIT